MGAVVVPMIWLMALPIAWAGQDELLSAVELARQHHKQAASYSEWVEGGFSPQALAETFASDLRIPGIRKALCKKIARWPVEDLYHVSEILNLHLEGCLKKVSARYENYLNRCRSDLLRKVELEKTSQLLKAGPGSATQVLLVDFEKMPVVIDGDLPPKTLVLTFDDGPHPTRTPELLAELESEGLLANFFMVGHNSSLYRDLVREVASKGHELGSHSISHADLRKLSFEEGVREIEGGFSPLTLATGRVFSFFRFPYGANTTALRRYLGETRTPEFFWNIDTFDWKYKNPNFLLSYALDQIRHAGHGVVLFHDIQPQTIAVFPTLIRTLKNEDYQFAVFRPTATRLTPRP